MGAVEFSSPEGAHRSQSLPLISAARMQKFDLLLHLAVNLAQPIVVCGPKGIGKTTFLRLLETRLAPLATVRYLASAPGMSYERIFDELSRTLNQDKPGSASPGTDLNDLLADYAKEHRNLVLLLDNAGALVPGLLNALWQSAARYPALRLVLAMRTDEVRQKSDTDRSALGDAFTLEIPALSPDECRYYARQLATGGIAESFIGSAYSRSQGIPGAVVEMLNSPDGSKKAAALGSVGRIAGAGLLAGAAAYAIFLAVSRQFPAVEKPAAEVSVVRASPDRVIVAPPSPETVQNVETSNPAVPPAPSQEPGVIAQSVAVSQPPPVSAPLAEREEAKAPPVPDPPATVPLPAQLPVPDSPAAIQAPVPPPTMPISAQPPVPAPSAVAPVPVQPPAAAVPPVETEAKKAEESPKPAESEARREPPPAMEEPKDKSKTPSGVPPVRPEPASASNGPETETPQAGASNVQGGEKQEAKPSEVIAEGLKSAEWLMNQNPDAYTLQIVAVSRLSSVVKLAKQFPPGGELATFRSRKGAGDLYPLFFGIYPTLPAAKAAAASLPRSLGQPLPRQMKSIHQEILRMTPRRAEPGSSAR